MGGGTRARQAQSRAKALERIERIERAPSDGAALSFQFDAPERSGRVTFELEDARIEVGEPPIVLLDHAQLWLERGEHVSLVGPNGAGKTTLIETLTGQRPLGGGQAAHRAQRTVGYLSQHADELGNSGTVLEATQRATGLTPNKARALLGRFLFSGELAEKPLAGLSGGERRRLSLAILVAGGANVLILDEPTNHLDLESREALEDALALLRRLADPRLPRPRAARRRRHADDRGGGRHAAQLRRRLARVRARARGAQGGGRGSQRPAPPRPRAGRARRAPPGERAAGAATPPGPAPRPSKNRLREQEKAERAVEAAEAALAALEQELSDPAAWATKYETAKNEARHTAAKRAVEAAYARARSRVVALIYTQIMRHARNIAIILLIALAVVALPGGSDTAG